MQPTTTPEPRFAPTGEAGQTAAPTSATVADMTTAKHAANTDTGRDTRVLFRVLLTLTGAVAAVTFALSYYGIRDYGERVMGLPRWMSWLAPVAVDVFSLVGLVSAIALATATLRSRSYAWFVFVVAAGASVGANIAHANDRHLPWAGVVGAAGAPLFFLLSSHLAVVVRRHTMSQQATRHGPDMSQSAQVTPVVGVAPRDMPDAPETDTTLAGGVSLFRPYVVADHVAPADTTTSQQTSQTPTRAVAAKVRHSDKPASRKVSQQSDTDSQKIARRRVARGDTCAAVARDIGVSAKTVERWTADIRARRANATSDSDTKPVNGSTDHPDFAGVSP